MHTTRSIPAGCFVGVLTIFPATIAILAGYGLHRWYQLPEEKRLEHDVLSYLAWALCLGILGTMAVGWLAYRIHKNTIHPDDPNDYKGPLI